VRLAHLLGVASHHIRKRLPISLNLMRIHRLRNHNLLAFLALSGLPALLSFFEKRILFRKLFAGVAQNYMQKPLVLAVFWVEYFTLFSPYDIPFPLSEEFKEWDFA